MTAAANLCAAQPAIIAMDTDAPGVEPAMAVIAPLDGIKLMRLLQLVSPALPVGGYSYSQGLEAAVAAGLISCAADARGWIETMLLRFMSRNDAVLMLVVNQASADGHWQTLQRANAFSLASRESRAARDESRQMGWSLLKLARQLGWLDPLMLAQLEKLTEPAYPVVFALAGRGLGLEARTVVSAYLFGWLENQIIALQKLAAVGQSAGQGLLHELAGKIPAAVDAAVFSASAGIDGIETLAPHLAILLARHESQYSRIFRT